MKQFVPVVAVALLSLGLSPTRGEAESREESVRPNLVLIVADDLGYGNLGCYGQPHIQTPVLDRMARDGLRFTRFYAGASLCLPSRCSLMSGLHTGHSRCRSNGGGGTHPPIAEEDTTLGTVLQAAGYKTGMIGKWALGDDFIGCVVEHQNIDGSGAVYKHGWDYYFGEPNQTYNHRYYPPQLYRYDPHGWIGDKTQGKRLDAVPLENDRSGKSGRQYSHDLGSRNKLLSGLLRCCHIVPFGQYLVEQNRNIGFEIIGNLPTSFVHATDHVDGGSQAGGSGRFAHETYHGVKSIKENPLTCARNMRKEAAFDRVVFRTVARKVGHSDWKVQVIGKILEVALK
jgi:hypothetical protein